MDRRSPICEPSVCKTLLRWTPVALLAVAGSLVVALLAEHTPPQDASPDNAHRLAATGANLEAVPPQAGAAAEPAPTQPDNTVAEEQPPTF